MGPVADAFGRGWPEADCMNLLDDRLSADLASAGALDAALSRRFVDLALYATRAGARGILFTCSAFGPAIEAAAAAARVPTYKPNEAMFEQALAQPARGGAALRIGLLSTFAPSVLPMRDELRAMAAARGVPIELTTACADGALEALRAGDADAHDRRVEQAADALGHCDVVMLGQFSMAPARQRVMDRIGREVLSSPDSAVRRLRQAMMQTAT